MTGIARLRISTSTTDVMLALITVAEYHLRRCTGCWGVGRIPEYFEAFHLVRSERLQLRACGRATLWHSCVKCADLRTAIAAARAHL